MSGGGVDPAAVWTDAKRAAEILAVEPFLLGGLWVRAWPGPPRERLLHWLRALLPGRPMLRLPLHISDDRLLGGLSLAATLSRGTVVVEQGLLAQADGGVVVAAMAERMEPRVTSQLCGALDAGAVLVERDAVSALLPCRFAVVALDEGIEDERAPAALRDRLALAVDLSSLAPSSRPEEEPDAERVERARARLPGVTIADEAIDALCAATLALGVGSLRAAVMAATVARVNAALAGRDEVEEEDLSLAARLVLGPRATRLPVPESDDDEEPPPPPPDDAQDDEPPEPPEPPDDEKQDPSPQPPLDEIVLEAARSGIPAGLLDLLVMGVAPRSSPRSAGQAGALRTSTEGGRPAGVRAGAPRSGERLNVVETLRAAAPWQPLRRRGGAAAAAHGAAGRRHVEVRRDDFRVTRFKQRSQTSVIFSVDASGSAAMQRLAEAKGAVEQVLSDCYVRRDHVALVAFRNAEAQLLLSPTRSLVRVRRSLADLAGGGTTPLAAGIDAALALAMEARKRGHTPVLVLMTDGRGNVARDGREGRPGAEADALEACRAVRAASVRALFLDTSPRPRPAAQKLAAEMGARYLPLPYLDAEGISTEVQRLAEED